MSKNEIVSIVTINDEQEIDDDEELALSQKHTTTAQKQKQYYQSASTGLKFKRRQILHRFYFSVRYGQSPRRKLEP